MIKFQKKSLGQNFLIDKNIVKKILNLTNLNNKNIIEIGPGKGALTDEIIKRKPKSLLLLEKDNELSNNLKLKFLDKKSIKIINIDVLRFNFQNLNKQKFVLLGNLPYNISSQILIKLLKIPNLESKFTDLILMFQKELAEKIIAKFPSKNYGRLSIITNLKFFLKKKFLVSSNCFFPKPKVTSMVLHFKTIKNQKSNIKELSNLEKVTNIIFSNKRKKINKSIKKILNKNKLKKIKDLDLNLRAEKIEPKMYYKITELFEESQ